MKILLLSTILLLGTLSEVLGDPDAGPGPSPVADPGRNKLSAVRPVITREPIDKIPVRGKSERLECAAEGYPSPTISWLKDGRPFEGRSGAAFALPSGEIMFYSVKSSDEGIYTCLARNSAGVARSRNATLQVAYIKDDFRTIPEDRVAAVGGAAELRCEGPRGVPEPRISWKKDGRPLSPDGGRIRIERGKLVISGAIKGDSGKYQCIASNTAGRRASVSVLLAVHEPPLFTVKPEDQTVVVGGDLDLACEARGDPKPRIRWTKPDGVQNSRVASLNNGNLRITNVQSGDGGKYICSAENIAGEISSSAIVTVNRKPEFVRLPTDTTARVGSTVTIPCWAEGKPEPTILWHATDGPNMFPGNPYNDGHIVVRANGDLTIYNVQFSDQGKYICEAYNSNGPKNAAAQLTVISRQNSINPPVIRRGPSNMTLAQGSSVELRCTSSAVPVPNFSWTKDGSGDLKTGNKYTVSNSGTLTISNIQNGDAGRYTCTATNDFGWSKWDAWIEVAAKGAATTTPTENLRNIPGVPSSPVLVNTTATTVTLKWSPSSHIGASAVTGYALEYYCLQSDTSTWVRVGGPISSTVYTLRGLKPASKYVFLVRTRNNHGTSNPSKVSDTFTTFGANPTSGSPDSEIVSQISVRVTSAKPLSTASSSGGGGIQLNWESTTFSCDVIDGFKVHIQPVSIRKGVQRVETVGCHAGNTELRKLQSRVVYEIRVRPYKGEAIGRPSPMILASPESEGTEPTPPTLEVKQKSGDDVSCVGIFTWQRPGSIMPEYITRYSLRCYDKNDRDLYDVTKHVNSSVESMTLKDLPRGREYAAYVTFTTQLGEGVASSKLEFTVEAATAPPSGGLSDIMTNPGILAGIAACVVVIIAIIVGVVLYRRHKKNKKSRGLHVRSFSFTPQPGRAGIPMDPFSGTQYSKGFTMSLTNQNNTFSDGTGSSTGNANGNLYMPAGGMTAPPSVTRNTTVSLNNSNGNVGTSLSPDMHPAARHASSFSYVTDQLTSMSSIPPQFSSPNIARTPTQVMSSAELQLQMQQQLYQRQFSDNPTVLADEISPHGDLIDMNTPVSDDRYVNDLPPPPPSPPMSQKTSLSDRTNRSRGSSRNSAERGSSHSSKGRRSRERNRGFQPLERVATDTDTGIDSPQQTPSPPRPSDLRAEHPSNSQPRGPAEYPYGSKQHSGRRRNDGIAVEYPRGADTNLGYLGGPSEGETESEVGVVHHGRPKYIPHPEEVRNSVAASSVSMMNRYDSESSDRSQSPTSSIESLNMESASQVGANIPQNVMPQRSAFVPIQTQVQYNGGGTPNRGGYPKPKVPKKYYKDQQRPVNGHYTNNNPHMAAPEQFLNRINSASSSASGSSSYHQNTADSGMSAGQGSYGHNSLNSSSSAESGPKSQMSRSRTTGSLSAENQPVNQVENGPHFASVDRRYIMNNNMENTEYQQPRGRMPATQPPRVPRSGNGSRSPQRKNSQDSNLSLPQRDASAYIDYETNVPTDRQPMLPDHDYITNDADMNSGEESRTAFSAAKSVFGGSIAPKPARGRHPELSDVPEATTSDFCEDYSDRSQ